MKQGSDINVKKRSIRLKTDGFSLIEVAVSIMIFGFMMTSIFALQTSLLRSAARFVKTFDGVVAAQNFLVEAHKKWLFSSDKEYSNVIKETEIKVFYKVTNFPKDSEWKSYPGLHPVDTGAQWQLYDVSYNFKTPQLVVRESELENKKDAKEKAS